MNLYFFKSKLSCLCRRFTFVQAIMLGILLFSGCQPTYKQTSLQRIIDRGYITVGTLYGPNSYYISAEGPAGFEYELAKKYADYLGVDLKVVATYNLEDLFPKLSSSEVDFLAAGLTETKKRRELFDFSPVYQKISQKVVFKQGNKWPRALENLTGSLMVTSSSSHVEQLEEIQKDYPDLNWKETSELDNEEILIKVLEGEIDYTIVDSHVLAMSRRYYPELSIAFTLKDEDYLAWLLRKKGDAGIRASLIEFFGQVHQDGTLLVLDDKHFGHVEKFNYVDTRLFLQAVDEKLPKYQAMFEKHSQEIDWRLLAAISYQESHWEPNARSYTGVRGLMMLTLATAKQMGIKSRLDPEESIYGGAKYFKRMINKMPERIPEPDRTWFALASYNVGFGHLNDARIITQRQGGDPDRWFDVKTRLPLLKQKKYYKNTKYGYARGDEPVKYVEGIRRYYESLSYIVDKAIKAEEERQQAIAAEKAQALLEAAMVTDENPEFDNNPEASEVEESGIQGENIDEPLNKESNQASIQQEESHQKESQPEESQQVDIDSTETKEDL